MLPHSDFICDYHWSCSFTLTFFFLMIRPPPRSTLFPSRRSSDLKQPDPIDNTPVLSVPRRSPSGPRTRGRSEEHTSELQSHSDLVCRLLLEKKKRKKNRRYTRSGRHSRPSHRRWRFPSQ